VQEVFLAAHRSLADFRGDSRFSTWLHRIAVNRALNHRELAAERLRRDSVPLEYPDGAIVAVASARALSPDPGEGATPLREVELAELKRRLADCLAKMPAAWRAVLTLRLGESLPYQEIARLVGTELGTVRSRLARARLAMRRCVLEEA
jgi:RNA polymerase sigma-70 factor (ECF subfamily)